MDSFSIMYLEMNRKELYSKNNSIRFTASSIICCISMLTRLILYSFSETVRHILQHKFTAIFFHSFYKSATSHVRRYLLFYLRGISYLFHLAVHHGQLVLFKENRLLGTGEIVPQLPCPPTMQSTALNTINLIAFE